MARRGFTTASLAEALGISRSHLSKMLNGHDPIDPHRVALAALGFDVKELSVPDRAAQDAARVERAKALSDLTLGDLAKASRRAQGLPDTVTDARVLDAIARVIATALLRTEAPSAPEKAGR